MTPIVRILFGSHLYGTALPTSDTDYKSVYLPSAEDILLQRKVASGTISLKTKDDAAGKNSPDDVDDESFSLVKFFAMLQAGESQALELLFTPPENIVIHTKGWKDIQDVRPRLLTRNCKGFVGYCQRQAAKYGIRGSRVATTRDALRRLENWIAISGPQAKLGTWFPEIELFVDSHEHTSIIEIPQPRGDNLPHWEVCDRKLPFTISLKEAHHIMSAVLANYGQRALAAERNEGIDWKAVAHAVRVGEQAVELLSTGYMTFPRPNAEELIRIRLGERPYAEVQDKLEFLLADVEAASRTSSLPEEVDRHLMDHLIMQFHARQIAKSPWRSS